MGDMEQGVNGTEERMVKTIFIYFFDQNLQTIITGKPIRYLVSMRQVLKDT
jgi:hypothetical protein